MTRGIGLLFFLILISTIPLAAQSKDDFTAEDRARLTPRWNTEDFGINAAIAQTFTITNNDEWIAAIKAIDVGGNNKNYVVNITAAEVSGGAFVRTHSGVKISVRGTGKNLVENSPFRSLEGDCLILRNIIHGSIVIGKGASLIMRAGSRSGRITVNAQGSFVMEDGEISGIYTEYGSGAGVNIDGGTFTMNGGTISGNRTDYYGGGVYIGGGTFTMNGGTISGNIAGSNRHSNSSGGGVCVERGTFTMNGGTISDNAAIFYHSAGPRANRGGGVFVAGTFIMNGGTIFGADEGNKSNRGTGAAIYVAIRQNAKYGNGALILEGYRIDYIDETITGKR